MKHVMNEVLTPEQAASVKAKMDQAEAVADEVMQMVARKMGELEEAGTAPEVLVAANGMLGHALTEAYKQMSGQA